MKKTIKILVILAVFLLAFLAWPDFKEAYDFDCSGVSEEFIAQGGECGVRRTYDYGNWNLGGGWRYLDNSFCAKDGKILLYSGECYQSSNQSRSLPIYFALLGSVSIAVTTGLALFAGPIIFGRKKTKIQH